MHSMSASEFRSKPAAALDRVTARLDGTGGVRLWWRLNDRHDLWSCRITTEHRIVHAIGADTVQIVSCRTHYG